MRESTRGIRWCAPVQSRCTIAVCCTMFEQPLRNVYFCCHGRQRVCVHDMGIHPSLLGVVTSCASPWSNNHCGTFLWSCQQVSYIGVAPGMVPAVVGCVCVCVTSWAAPWSKQPLCNVQMFHLTCNIHWSDIVSDSVSFLACVNISRSIVIKQPLYNIQICFLTCANLLEWLQHCQLVKHLWQGINGGPIHKSRN